MNWYVSIISRVAGTDSESWQRSTDDQRSQLLAETHPEAILLMRTRELGWTTTTPEANRQKSMR